MESEDKKVVVNLPEGASTAEITIREGSAPQVLDPKPPVKINLQGVIGTPVEFLTQRSKESDQFNEKRAHVIVERENVEITLVFNENDEYTCGKVSGKLFYHPKFVEFGINAAKGWTPNKLGEFFKMNRAFFPDREKNMELVSKLKNFDATVSSKIEKERNENGSFKDNYGAVVQSNLPDAFMVKIPIFKGTPAENLEVEIYASVNGRDVTLSLVSPSALQILEEQRDKVIDEQVKLIRQLCPGIVIVEK